MAVKKNVPGIIWKSHIGFLILSILVQNLLSYGYFKNQPESSSGSKNGEIKNGEPQITEFNPLSFAERKPFLRSEYYYFHAHMNIHRSCFENSINKDSGRVKKIIAVATSFQDIIVNCYELKEVAIPRIDGEVKKSRMAAIWEKLRQLFQEPQYLGQYDWGS